MNFFEPLLLEKLNDKAKALKLADLEALSTLEVEDEMLGEEDFIDTLIEAKEGESLEELEEKILQMGGKNLKKYPHFLTVAAEIPFNKILGLKNQPKVKGVYDGIGKIKYFLDESVNLIFTHDKIKLPDKMPDTGKPPDGSGIVVCIVDTGIDSNHPDLSENILKIKDFTDDGDGIDYDGHGTHVASTICGSGKASGGTYRGVAPGAKLLIAKVFDRDLNTSRRIILDAILWALDNGADIVNLSLGDSSTAKDGTCPLCKAVDYVSENGVFVACAAGNEAQSPDGVEFGSGTICCPGNARGAFTVGAATKQGEIAYFSSRGPTADGRQKPDAAAPGVDITAAKPGNGYQKLSGTSMATPHVAGAAAVLKQLYSSYSIETGIPDTLLPDEMKTALKAGALDLGEDANAQGAGMINIPASFNWLEWNKLGAKVSSKKGKRKSHKFAEIVTALFIVVAFATFCYVNPSPFKLKRQVKEFIINKSHAFVSRFSGNEKPSQVADKSIPDEGAPSTTESDIQSQRQLEQNDQPSISNLSQSGKVHVPRETQEAPLPFDEKGSFNATDKEIRRLLEYVDEHPDSLEPFADLILLLVENGETDDATTLLNDLIDRNPDNEGLLYNLSLIYMQNKRYKDAIQVLNVILNKNKNNSSASYLLSLAERRQDEVEKSVNSRSTKETSPGQQNIKENHTQEPERDSVKAFEAGSNNNTPDTINIADIRKRLSNFWKEHISPVAKAGDTSSIAYSLSAWSLLTPYEKVNNALLLSLYFTILFYIVTHILTRGKTRKSKTLGIKDVKTGISVKDIARHSFNISLSLNIIYFIVGAMTLFVTALRIDNHIGPYINNPKNVIDLFSSNKTFVVILILIVIAKLSRMKRSPSF